MGCRMKKYEENDEVYPLQRRNLPLPSSFTAVPPQRSGNYLLNVGGSDYEAGRSCQCLLGIARLPWEC
jgi:hypothetical protein